MLLPADITFPAPIRYRALTSPLPVRGAAERSGGGVGINGTAGRPVGCLRSVTVVKLAVAHGQGATPNEARLLMVSQTCHARVLQVFRRSVRPQGSR